MFRTKLADALPVFWQIGEEENMLILPLLSAFSYMYLLSRIRVIAKVIHRRGVGHRRGCEVLYLIGHQAVFVRDVAQTTHLFDGAAGVRGDEIGNQLLVLAAFSVFIVEIFQEVEEMVERGFAH